MKLQTGWELGMKPIESLNSLYIVNGRVTIWGAALIRQMRKHGWSVSYTDESADGCTIVATHRKPVSRDLDDETLEDTFLYQDAVDSGYTQDNYGKEKVGWRKGQNRKLKLRYGAASQLAKTYLPEVLGSVAGVAEMDQDAPLIVEPDAVRDSAGGDYEPKIKAAGSREEILEIISELPVEQRRRATQLAESRMRELVS